LLFRKTDPLKGGIIRFPKSIRISIIALTFLLPALQATAQTKKRPIEDFVTVSGVRRRLLV